MGDLYSSLGCKIKRYNIKSWTPICLLKCKATDPEMQSIELTEKGITTVPDQKTN